jgi:ATP-dependent DNA helicase DinG
MQTFFGSGGRLAAALPGFEPRPEQAALAEAIAAAIADREHLLAEAGTGTGKSLAYVVPALVSGKRVVVATATKTLQDQLLTKDVPAAAAALNREVRVAVLKGRQNYLCQRSLHGFELLGGSAGALFRTAEDAGQFDALRDWIETTATGDRAELPFEPSPTLWADLAVGADRCRRPSCPFVQTCFSELARGRAAEAELVIVNHALYFADLALRGRPRPGGEAKEERERPGEGSGVLPDHDAVVFDEAHRLEESAASWFGGRVSLAGLRQLARDVERACREASEAPPARALARVDRLGAAALTAVEPVAGRRRLTEREVDRGAPAFLALAEALDDLGAGLAGGGEDHDALARRARRLGDDVEKCLDLDDPAFVSWSEAGAVAWAPVEVAELLRDRLWSGRTTAILVSATLEPAFLRERLGLDDAREAVFSSPFDFRSQALLYVPERVPEPRAGRGAARVRAGMGSRDPSYFAALADEVVELCRLSRGRALVLTSSYRALDELVDRCSARLPFPVLRQGDLPRERLLERFREEVDSVLFATSTFWQGVDVQGESLSLLVIDKLPFAAPGDPLVEARCERIARRGGDWFGEYAVPSAILQLRQGFGRLIRSHEDEGVVAVLDPRLRTRSYGRRFLEALPPAPLVSDRGAVAAFFGVAGRDERACYR